VGGYAPRALEEIVRTRPLVGASGRPLNFTVRGRSVKLLPKLLITAVGSFLAGVLVTGIAANYAFSNYMRTVFAANYYEQAVHAQFMAHELSMLRAGNTDKPVQDLERMLDGYTLYLSGYETAVPETQRDPNIHRLMADVRAYRTQFPAHFEDPSQQARYQKALDLGKKTDE
jgi:hypothetical protein